METKTYPRVAKPEEIVSFRPHAYGWKRGTDFGQHYAEKRNVSDALESWAAAQREHAEYLEKLAVELRKIPYGNYGVNADGHLIEFILLKEDGERLRDMDMGRIEYHLEE